MLIAAFLVTAFAGMVIGIWLSARSAKGQMPVNPIKMWAFADTLKKKTIEAYSEELSSALLLKYPDERIITAPLVTAFIKEYTDSILKHETTRR